MHPLGNGIFPRILSALYESGVRVRNFLFDNFPALAHDADRPLISIGGINAGGVGKTPLALLVGTFLKNNGYEVVFLSRGFRRKSVSTVICKPLSITTWETVGDEPALLQANMPKAWLGIGADRLKTIRLMSPLLSRKAVFVLDDGFQHRRVRRDMDIVCVPAHVFDDHMLPAGTLREPLIGMKRAHCICVIGSPEENISLAKTKEMINDRFKNRVAAVLHQVPAGWVHAGSGTVQAKLPLKRPLLLCGIARPERFTRLVRSLEVVPVNEVLREDHHEFTAAEIENLCRDTNSCDGILTTEKDACRLKTLNLVNCPDIWYLKIGLQFPDPDSKSVFLSRLSGSISL
jgi:tetraacyldisaccharide 4'-kinase